MNEIALALIPLGFALAMAILVNFIQVLPFLLITSLVILNSL